MFAHSETLILRFFHLVSKTGGFDNIWNSWDNIYIGLPYLSKESIFLNCSSLTCINLSFLQQSYCRTTVFVNLWLSPLKQQKVEKQQQQNR